MFTHASTKGIRVSATALYTIHIYIIYLKDIHTDSTYITTLYIIYSICKKASFNTFSQPSGLELSLPHLGKAMDTNGDGSLSLEEFRKSLSNREGFELL